MDARTREIIENIAQHHEDFGGCPTPDALMRRYRTLAFTHWVYSAPGGNLDAELSQANWDDIFLAYEQAAG